MEIGVIPVVDILDGREETGASDVRLLEQRFDSLKGKAHILDAAVDVAVDCDHGRCPIRSIKPFMRDPFYPAVTFSNKRR
jgi:hypothetical protein